MSPPPSTRTTLPATEDKTQIEKPARKRSKSEGPSTHSNKSEKGGKSRSKNSKQQETSALEKNAVADNNVLSPEQEPPAPEPSPPIAADSIENEKLNGVKETTQSGSKADDVVGNVMVATKWPFEILSRIARKGNATHRRRLVLTTGFLLMHGALCSSDKRRQTQPAHPTAWKLTEQLLRLLWPRTEVNKLESVGYACSSHAQLIWRNLSNSIRVHVGADKQQQQRQGAVTNFRKPGYDNTTHRSGMNGTSYHQSPPIIIKSASKRKNPNPRPAAESMALPIFNPSEHSRQAAENAARPKRKRNAPDWLDEDLLKKASTRQKQNNNPPRYMAAPSFLPRWGDKRNRNSSNGRGDGGTARPPPRGRAATQERLEEERARLKKRKQNLDEHLESVHEAYEQWFAMKCEFEMLLDYARSQFTDGSFQHIARQKIDPVLVDLKSRLEQAAQDAPETMAKRYGRKSAQEAANKAKQNWPSILAAAAAASGLEEKIGNGGGNHTAAYQQQGFLSEYDGPPVPGYTNPNNVNLPGGGQQQEPLTDVARYLYPPGAYPPSPAQQQQYGMASFGNNNTNRGPALPPRNQQQQQRYPTQHQHQPSHPGSWGSYQPPSGRGGGGGGNQQPPQLGSVFAQPQPMAGGGMGGYPPYNSGGNQQQQRQRVPPFTTTAAMFNPSHRPPVPMTMQHRFLSPPNISNNNGRPDGFPWQQQQQQTGGPYTAEPPGWNSLMSRGTTNNIGGGGGIVVGGIRAPAPIALGGGIPAGNTNASNLNAAGNALSRASEALMQLNNNKNQQQQPGSGPAAAASTPTTAGSLPAGGSNSTSRTMESAKATVLSLLKNLPTGSVAIPSSLQGPDGQLSMDKVLSALEMVPNSLRGSVAIPPQGGGGSGGPQSVGQMMPNLPAIRTGTVDGSSPPAMAIPLIKSAPAGGSPPRPATIANNNNGTSPPHANGANGNNNINVVVVDPPKPQVGGGDTIEMVLQQVGQLSGDQSQVAALLNEALKNMN